MPRVLCLCPLLLSLLGCDGGAAPDAKTAALPAAELPTPAQEPADEATPQADAPQADAPQADAPAQPPPPLPQLERPADMPALPELSATPANKQAKRECEVLIKAGIELYAASDYPGAAAKFLAAVEADPSELLARYELARAYTKQGKTAWALALLDDFAHDTSPSSANRLLRAPSDPGFAALHSDPSFLALSAAEGRLPRLDEAGAQIEAWADSWAKAGEAERPPLFDARHELGLVVHDWREGVAKQDSKEKLPELTKLDARLAKLRDATTERAFLHGEPRSCAQSCCSWPAGESAQPGNLYLSEVCFQMVGAGVLHVQRIEFAKS